MFQGHQKKLQFGSRRYFEYDKCKKCFKNPLMLPFIFHSNILVIVRIAFQVAWYLPWATFAVSCTYATSELPRGSQLARKRPSADARHWTHRVPRTVFSCRPNFQVRYTADADRCSLNCRSCGGPGGSRTAQTGRDHRPVMVMHLWRRIHKASL